ncbi:FG-GAP repeat domain-containing protein [Pseudodonghicola flavimaris]|uniref:VCBS repeat-containing protein n=1 Tax=Pseudodonghicola flavimaris TaxID=3050036 RepID=A0ABT7EUZ6_9RHOB|nr:VCBS repeat-containing protein [Pseudodonghicola flavimaris]MDK3016128.1 VCBS repeat-containing protein [Pseudodonghicola flavimaris]
MRRAARLGAAALLGLAGLIAGPASACDASIVAARYLAPTDRYPHGALGDPWEWGALEVTLALCDGMERRLRHDLPRALVFEDVQPRRVDLDADGRPELLTVESHRRLGARLAIWGQRDGRLTRLAATPHIGQANRWLAPLGAADLDGDGRFELAYIDRPHLARTLRIWRYADATLTQIATAPGLTNHRFGDKDIAGGLRDCGAGPEIVTADADWQHLIASRLRGGTIDSRVIGPDTSAAGFAAALSCAE